MKAAIVLLLFLPALAQAADLNVAWKNAATYNDGSAMPSTDIASSTVSCGLNQTSLTLIVTAPGAAQSAVVPGALAGKTYVCGVQTNSQNNGSSAVAFSNNIGVPAPKPSQPTGVTLTVSATNPTAYKLRQSVDGMAMVSIGTVAPGTACDAAQSVNGYSLVPRAAVTLASKFDTLPLIVFANCS